MIIKYEEAQCTSFTGAFFKQGIGTYFVPEVDAVSLIEKEYKKTIEDVAKHYLYNKQIDFSKVLKIELTELEDRAYQAVINYNH